MIPIYWMTAPIATLLQGGEQELALRYLSPAEQLTYGKLSIEKRRRDWLAGRIAIKSLYAAVEQPGSNLATLFVEREESGAPYLTKDGSACSGFITISHSQGLVAVGYTANNMRIGIDIEEVTPRDPAFLTDYFTELEQAWILDGEIGNPDMRSTLLWSAKESILKCISSGLAMDPLRVEIKTDETPFQFAPWGRLTGLSREPSTDRNWQVHWSERSNSVLTLSAPVEADIRLQEVQYPGNL